MVEPIIPNPSDPVSRRDEIVATARELYETQGLDRTSVKDITEKLGVTRSLFYHYFANKDAVTEAVIDDYVNDFLQLVYYWNEGRERGNVRGALQSCVRMLRQGIFDRDRFRLDLVENENASLYLQFASRAAESLATYVNETTVPEYHRYHEKRISYTYEVFYVLITGMVSFMRRYPDTPDEVLEALVAQTLQLDLDGRDAPRLEECQNDPRAPKLRKQAQPGHHDGEVAANQPVTRADHEPDDASLAQT